MEKYMKDVVNIDDIDLMFIQFKRGGGRGVYHISISTGKDHDGPFVYGEIFTLDSNKRVTLCNGNFPINSDYLGKNVPGGTLCKSCKRRFVKKYGSDELLLAVL